MGVHEISNIARCSYTNIQMQGNTRNTDDFLKFRYETFINFLRLGFRHEERETQFLLY